MPSTSQSASSAQSHLDAAARLVSDCVQKTRRGNRLTVLVGAALVLLFGAYFVYGYHEISDLAKPENLLSLAESKIDEYLPEARRAIESEVDKSAPVWAASLSKQAQSSLPAIREKLEEYVLDQVEQSVGESVDLTEAQFRKFLQDNRDTLTVNFNDLATSPQLADEALDRMVEMLQANVEVDMKQTAKDLFVTLEGMNAHLLRLKTGEKLTPEETLERQILMRARRLQSEHVNLDVLGDATGETTITLPGTKAE